MDEAGTPFDCFQTQSMKPELNSGTRQPIGTGHHSVFTKWNRTAHQRERRLVDRRKSGRGGRRNRDRGRPWWQKGLVIAALCALTRCWRAFRAFRA
jgi:hypothetical protein